MATTFTQRAADRIARAVQWVERQMQTGYGAVAQGAVQPVDPVWVRTTSGTATGGLYPGVVCLYSASDATWNEYSAVKVKGPNGETLSDNTRYACRPAGRSGSDEVYILLQGQSGGLTVKEVDGSPSIAGVTELRIDQTTGLVASSPASGVAAVSLAMATVSTQGGMDCTGTQTFGGYKVFTNQCTFSGGIIASSIDVGDATTYATTYIRSRNGVTLDGWGANGTILEGAQVINGIVTGLGSGGTGLTGTVP